MSDDEIKIDFIGVQCKKITFLFSDTQLKEESFLEDISNILSSSQVPNLYSKEDLEPIYSNLKTLGNKLLY